jgi:hypothetical protein
MDSFTIGFIRVSRTQCLILFNEGFAGAVLWDSNQQPLSSSELIVRSMWLSLATKAMAENWRVSVSTDGAGLLTSITVVDTNTTGSSILPSMTDEQREELIQQLLNRQKQSLVASLGTAQ